MKLSETMHNAMVDAYKRVISNDDDQRVNCAPNTLAALRRRGFVYEEKTTINRILTPEGLKYGEEWEETTYTEDAQTEKAKPFTISGTMPAEDAQTEKPEPFTISGTMPAGFPAGFLAAIDKILPVARQEIDDNGRFVGDDAPFNVIDYLPTIPATRLELRQMTCDGCEKSRVVRSDDGRTLLCRDCRRLARKMWPVDPHRRARTPIRTRAERKAAGTRKWRRNSMKARKHRDQVGNYHHKIHVPVGHAA